MSGKTKSKKKKREFGSRDLIIRNTGDWYDSQDDINSLDIPKNIKRSILGGVGGESHPKQKEGFDEVRDWGIIQTLIEADYGYDTIKSIFFNDNLLCSGRYRELAKKEAREGDTKEHLLKRREFHLKQDIQFVRERLKTFRLGIYGEDQQKIQKIRDMAISREEQLQRMRTFITNRLLKNISSPGGEGFYDEDKNIFYFFDKYEKLLMDLEGVSFYCYLRDRFGLLKKDYDEMRDSVMTTIWQSKKKIKAHIFAYFDDRNFKLYISDHFNGIYRLDGEKIEHVANGTDGVFFEYNPEFIPLDVDINKLEGVNYFEVPKSKKVLKAGKTKLIFPKHQILGLNWNRFNNSENPSYLKKYLIDRVSFAPEEEYGLSPEEQKILLTIYFYSLFFESIQKEKPVICFVGLKASGKSFIAESIGKILFGDGYQIRHMASNVRDFHTLLATNYYLAFDNLDQYIEPELLDAFCVAATGGTVERRKLYTDREIVRFRPTIFIVVTSREAKFKRDDLVSRLLLFKTEKIRRVIGRSHLFKTLNENRNDIMSEVLINLNSIIKLLKIQKDFNPSGISRIADFELFIKKVARGSERIFLETISDKMTTAKDLFALEGDPLYEILKVIIIEKGEVWRDLTSAALHSKLLQQADLLKIEDYKRRYRNPHAIGQKLKNIEDELNKVLKFNWHEGRGRVRYYSFYPLGYEYEPGREDK